MSMHKQNRDDDPAVHSFPPPNTRKHSLHANKNASSATRQLPVQKVAPTPKHLLAHRLCLLVDWLHPPRDSPFSSSILITISSQVSSFISNTHPQSCTHRVDHSPRRHRQPTSNAAEAARNPPNQAQHPLVQPKHSLAARSQISASSRSCSSDITLRHASQRWAAMLADQFAMRRGPMGAKGEREGLKEKAGSGGIAMEFAGVGGESLKA